MFTEIFHQIAVLLMVAVIMGMLAIRLRQPLILAFIVVGILASSSVLGWAAYSREIDLLSKIGITLLLFIVGLKLDIHVIRYLRKVAILAGMGQILLCFLVAYPLVLLLGLAPIPAIYVAMALTFSSTIIIIKLLSDKDEIDSLHGRISVGILIVQDIVVIIAIILLSSLGQAHNGSAGLESEIIALVLKSFGLLFITGIFSRFIFPTLLNYLASSRELLTLFAIAWAVILAALSEQIGLSKEIGGFLAGISLASTPFREIIGARLETLRNFLLLFFFIDLGGNIKFDLIFDQLFSVILLSAFVLIFKPLTVMVLLGSMGYRKITSFFTSVTLGQVSEFSLIFAALGVHFKFINFSDMSLITLVAMVTISISSYLILYDHLIYPRVRKYLSIFERKNPSMEDIELPQISKNIKIIVFGIGRYGNTFIRHLQNEGWKVLAIDFDPQRVTEANHHGILARYGDAEDWEYLKTLPLKQISWIVSTLPQREINSLLLQGLKENQFNGKVACTSYSDRDKKYYQKHAIDLILMPYKDAAKLGAEKLLEEII